MVDDEIGFMGVDIPVSDEIRRRAGLPPQVRPAYLGLANITPDSSGLEKRVDPSLFVQAARLLTRTETGEYLSKVEIQRILRNLANMGIPVEQGYQRLSSKRLYGFFRTTSARILREARKCGYKPAEETAA